MDEIQVGWWCIKCADTEEFKKVESEEELEELLNLRSEGMWIAFYETRLEALLHYYKMYADDYSNVEIKSKSLEMLDSIHTQIIRELTTDSFT